MNWTPNTPETPSDITAARSLGWASLGIGLAEIAAPKAIEKAIGIGNGQNTGILRALGVREIMHGVDILSHRDPGPGLHARLAGDLLDTTLLGLAARKTRRPGAFAICAAMVLGIGVLDMVFARRLSRAREWYRP